jgi:hypothetical protein
MLEVEDRIAKEPLGPVFDVDEASHFMSFGEVSQGIQL